MGLFNDDGTINEADALTLDDTQLATEAFVVEAAYADMLDEYRTSGTKPDGLGMAATRLRSMRHYLRALGELAGTRTLIRVDNNTEES